MSKDTGSPPHGRWTPSDRFTVSAAAATVTTLLAFAVGPEIDSAAERITAYGALAALVFAGCFGVMGMRATLSSRLEEARRRQINEDD